MTRPDRRDPPRSLHGDRPHVGELPLREDVDRELESHVAMAVDDLTARGWSTADARAEAMRRLGSMDRVRSEMLRETEERDRAVRRAHLLAGVWQDVSFAFRSMRRTPGFAVVALLTLTIGIGAVSSLFTVVKGVLLDPLPFEDPEELVYPWTLNTEGSRTAASDPDFLAFEEQARSLEGIAAYGVGSPTVFGATEAVRVQSASVSRDFWDIFRVTPVLGRLPGPDDHASGAPPVAVVSHGFWREMLGGVEDLSDSRIRTGTVDLQVVGVLPAGFDFPSGARIWVPWEILTRNPNRTAHNWRMVGRLAEGVSPETAAGEMERILSSLPGDADNSYLAAGAEVVPMREAIVGDSRRSLLLLLGASGLLLLLACTNLAATSLARGTTRARELAVRRSLGAGRTRLLRQLLTESVVLALAGGVGAALMAAGVVRILPAIASGVPRLESVRMGPGILLFTAGVAVAAGILFGLLPALRLTRSGIAGTLHSGERGSSERRSPIWTYLVAGEVALSLVLLVGSGLLLRSFQEVTSVDAGIRLDRIVVTDPSPSSAEYPDHPSLAGYYEEAVSRLEALPGVERAGVVSDLPLTGFDPTGRLGVQGPQEFIHNASYRVADAGYFDVMGIPLLRGRLPESSDGMNDPHVVVVSRSFADRVWPGENPLGQRISGGGMDSFWNADETVWATVVGVVGDVRHGGAGDDLRPTAYFPVSQRPGRLRFSAVVARTAGDPGSMVGPIRSTLGEVNPNVPFEVTTMRQEAAATVAGRRFTLLLMGAFGAVGIALALVGVYGVVSYSVVRRTREVGIRLTLGAAPLQVRGMILREALRMVLLGLAVGLLAALATSRLLETLLFEVTPLDPMVFVAAPLVLLAAGAAAGAIPAVRSARIDPLEAIRTE